MKAIVVKLKTAAALIALTVWSISSFAQVTTMYVMKDGEVVFESPVSGIDNVTFDAAAPGVTSVGAWFLLTRENGTFTSSIRKSYALPVRCVKTE